jgi:hypothetical protein
MPIHDARFGGLAAAMIVWGPGFVSTHTGITACSSLMTLRSSLCVRGGPTQPRRKAAALVRPDALRVDARGGTV